MADIADHEELLKILTERARGGNVGAAKTLLEELRRDPDENKAPKSKLEALDNVTPITKRRRNAS